MGVIAVLGSQIGSGISGNEWGDRLLNFGYLALLPLSASIFTFVRKKRFAFLRALLLTSIILYAIVGIFHIPPSLYTTSNNPLASDGRRFYFTPPEEQAAFWFNASGPIAVDERLPFTALHGVLYDQRLSISQGLDLSTIQQNTLDNFRYVFSRTPELPVLTNKDRIYDNGLVEIYYYI